MYDMHTFQEAQDDPTHKKFSLKQLRSYECSTHTVRINTVT